MPQGYEAFSSLILMGGLVLFMYLFVMRPQKKREKKTSEMRASIKQGDNIVTIGGIVGKVINIKDDELIIQTGVERTQLKVLRWAISEIIESKEAQA